MRSGSASVSRKNAAVLLARGTVDAFGDLVFNGGLREIDYEHGATTENLRLRRAFDGERPGLGQCGDDLRSMLVVGADAEAPAQLMDFKSKTRIQPER